MEFDLDLDTLRLLPWHARRRRWCSATWPGSTAADVVAVAAADPAGASSTRLARAGLAALAGTELEFIVFDDTYEQAWTVGLPRPDPGQPVQRRLLDPRHTRVEPLLRDIRNAMYAAGLDVERRQGRVQLRPARDRLPYAEALATADNHVVYKTGAKEIAAQHGKALTFMAKFNEREGNSCHIHLSLRGADGVDGRGVRRRRGARPVRRSYDQLRRRACWRTCAEFTLLYAPNINSYKRFAAGSFAPTAVAWGQDNRTCALRLVGHGAGAADGEPGARAAT